MTPVDDSSDGRRVGTKLPPSPNCRRRRAVATAICLLLLLAAARPVAAARLASRRDGRPTLSAGSAATMCSGRPWSPAAVVLALLSRSWLPSAGRLPMAAIIADRPISSEFWPTRRSAASATCFVLGTATVSGVTAEYHLFTHAFKTCCFFGRGCTPWERSTFASYLRACPVTIGRSSSAAWPWRGSCRCRVLGKDLILAAVSQRARADRPACNARSSGWPGRPG